MAALLLVPPLVAAGDPASDPPAPASAPAPMPDAAPVYLPGRPFAILFADGGNGLDVEGLVQPGGAFDILVVGLRDRSGTVLVTSPLGTVARPFDHEDGVRLEGFEAILGTLFEVAILDDAGAVAMTTGPTELVSTDVFRTGVFDPSGGGVIPVPGGVPDPSELVPQTTQNCYAGWTTARRTGQYGGPWAQTSTYSTGAIDLAKDEIAEDWVYQSGFTGGTVYPEEFRHNAFRWGHGWYGANQYRYGGSYDIGAASSIIGSRNDQNINTGTCGFVRVGSVFTISSPQVLYEDVSGVVAVHDQAFTKNMPSTSCTTVLPPVLKAALALTKSWGKLLAFIPNEYCVQNWSTITSANGKSGLGIQGGRLSQGSYEGSDSYIKTRYSSTGLFTMGFGDYVYYDVYAKGCTTCAAYTTAYWIGYDDPVYSIGKVTT